MLVRQIGEKKLTQPGSNSIWPSPCKYISVRRRRSNFVWVPANTFSSILLLNPYIVKNVKLQKKITCIIRKLTKNYIEDIEIKRLP
jgi:hypothetical protein